MTDFVPKIRLEGEDAVSPVIDGIIGNLGELGMGFEQIASKATGAFDGITGAVAAGTAAIAAAVVATTEMAVKTAEAANEIEHLTIKVATLYASTTDWASATAHASTVLPGLIDISSKTGLSLDDLGGAFRRLSILTGGADAGVQELVRNFAVASASIGTDVSQMILLIGRAATTGTLPGRGEAGFELSKVFQLDPEAIQNAYQAGTLLAYLSDHIKVTAEQADQLSMTWDVLAKGIATNARDIEATLGTTWEPLKIVFGELRDVLASDWIKALASELALVGKELISDELGQWYAKWVLLKDLLGPYIEDLRTVLALYEKISGEQLGWAGSVGNLSGRPAGAGPAADPFAAADSSYRKLVADFSRQNDLAGLTGLEKQLTAIADTNDKDVARLLEAWQKTNLGSAAFGADLAEITQATAKKIDQAWADTFAKQEKDAEAWSASVAKRYKQTDDLAAALADDLSKLAKKSSQDQLEILDEQAKADEDSRRRLYQKAVDQANALYADTVALPLANEITAKAARDAALKQAADALNAYLVNRDKELQQAKVLILDQQRGDYTKFYQDLMDKAHAAGDYTYATAHATLQKVASDALANAQTISQGLQAGLAGILAASQTTGEAIADGMKSAWNAMGTAFSSGFYDVLTGKIHDLGTVFKTFGDSLLKTLSDIFAKILQNWILTTAGISANPITGKLQLGGTSGSLFDPFTGGGVWGTAGNLGVGGLAGFGIGSGVGSLSGAPGFGTGAEIGGAVAGLGIAAAGAGLFGGAAAGAVGGSVVPIIGTIIGAIIGGLIGVLSSSNTEMSQFVNPSDMNAAGFAMHQVANNVAAGALGLYMSTGASASDVSAFGTSITNYLQMNAKGYKIHAGSDADMQADYKNLLTQVVPSELMHVLFGQQSTGAKDIAGIVGGSTWSATISDKTAPIVKMLTDLGFSLSAIQNIAGQIDLQSADAFGKYLTNLVGVVVGFQGLIKNLSMTPDQTFKSFADAANTSTASGFTAGAQNLVTLAQQLSLYTGADQVTKAQQLVQLGQQYQSSQLQYLQQLYNLSQSIIASVAGQKRTMALDLMTPGEKTSFYEADIGSLMGQLASAKTEAQVQALVQQIEADTSALWSGNKTSAMQTWINAVLSQTQAISTALINQFAATATASNAAVTAALTNATTLFTNLGPAVAANVTATTANTAAANANTASVNASTAAVGGFTTTVKAATVELVNLINGISNGDLANAIILTLQNNPALALRSTGR